tara:strand:+ start:3821 stop:4450 length:630 start_codon:yes stop_codon:yes gene_type:complete
MDHSHHMNSQPNPTGTNPCTDKLTDIEYLKHMIPHHQVAIDMSHMLVPHTNNPIMLHLCRDIIRKQNYEIWEMEMMKNNLSDTMFENRMGYIQSIPTKLEFYAPVMSMPEDGGCDPLFFKPDDHSKHMEHMEINDKSYLEHMIPHHQVAIDMSKRLLLHTNHSYLIDFCNKLIIDQQGEIYRMNYLLYNTYNYQSELLDIDGKDQNTLF